MRTTSAAAELLVELDRTRPRGLRAQVEAELRDAVRTGRLAPGTALPSSRALATDLGLTRGVVVAAYDQLIAEGYLVARPGSGTVVNPSPVDGRSPTTPTATATAPSTPIEVDFVPSIPDLRLFPRSAWLRATRQAIATLPDADIGYTDHRGLPQLRLALADYLARVRGVSADPERILVGAGFGNGFALLADVFMAAGHRHIAVEDPGYVGPRDRLDVLGARYTGVPVDGEGLVVDALRDIPARVVVVTPAHQSPTGVVLSSARRSALVEWAREVDGYVIEDDYDAEYRYDRQPVGALQGLAPDRVVYCGTTSKSVAPGLRLGWMVLPEPLVEPALTRRRVSDDFQSAFIQATYARFLTDGDLDRHLRRSRRVYRQRRDGLMQALARWFPEATPNGASAGLHVLISLPEGIDEAAAVEAALAAGVRVVPLARYRVTDRPDGPRGMVLGYGSITPEQSERGVRLLAEAVRTCSGERSR